MSYMQVLYIIGTKLNKQIHEYRQISGQKKAR